MEAVSSSSLGSLRFEGPNQAVTWIVTSDLLTAAARAMSRCKSNLRLSG